MCGVRSIPNLVERIESNHVMATKLHIIIDNYAHKYFLNCNNSLIFICGRIFLCNLFLLDKVRVDFIQGDYDSSLGTLGSLFLRDGALSSFYIMFK